MSKTGKSEEQTETNPPCAHSIRRIPFFAEIANRRAVFVAKRGFLW